MKKIMEDNSSSSEDESNLQALREAVDVKFFNNVFTSDEKGKQTETDSKVVKTVDNSDKVEFEDQHLHHGISQTCREFIAKKLTKRLNRELELEENTEENVVKNQSYEDTGIKLFKTSTNVLTKFEELVEPKNSQRKKKKKFDEKTNYLKCEEISVSPESVLAQQDTKHWTARKPVKEFRYKKLKNGTLIEIEKQK